MIVNCFHHSQILPYVIDLNRPTFPSPLLIDNQFTCLEYSQMIDKQYLMKASSPIQVPSFYLVSSNQSIIQPIDTIISYSHLLQWSIFQSTCDCILYQPITSSNHHLIVLLHGGPHRLFHASFNSDILFYIHKGYSVLVPNYHGSFGYGDHFLHSLCGAMGTIEVQDILNAIEIILHNPSYSIDPHKVCLMGSSYGGFLSLTLLERRPDLFYV